MQGRIYQPLSSLIEKLKHPVRGTWHVVSCIKRGILHEDSRIQEESTKEYGMRIAISMEEYGKYQPGIRVVPSEEYGMRTAVPS